ncbi:unnamed protein product [Amoebophrya sp. A25]|nr:unnamed protein product [Amoebophrya sp. A25]|eukprot:GSA25T00021074001.1
MQRGRGAGSCPQCLFSDKTNTRQTRDQEVPAATQNIIDHSKVVLRLTTIYLKKDLWAVCSGENTPKMHFKMNKYM